MFIPRLPSLSLLSRFYIGKNTVESIRDNYIRKKVTPIPGSIVYCHLLGELEHTGVYIGNNQIVHLDGDGIVEQVDPKQFLRRLNGMNRYMTAMSGRLVSIYVSCSGTTAVGSEGVARRAKSMIGNTRNYNVVLDNCHQFTSGCITGNFENPDNFFTFLQDTAKEYLSMNTWRVWER